MKIQDFLPEASELSADLPLETLMPELKVARIDLTATGFSFPPEKVPDHFGIAFKVGDVTLKPNASMDAYPKDDLKLAVYKSDIVALSVDEAIEELSPPVLANIRSVLRAMIEMLQGGGNTLLVHISRAQIGEWLAFVQSNTGPGALICLLDEHGIEIRGTSAEPSKVPEVAG